MLCENKGTDFGGSLHQKHFKLRFNIINSPNNTVFAGISVYICKLAVKLDEDRNILIADLRDWSDHE